MAAVLRENTTVAVVGAGPAGLTVANLLRRCGIGCVVVEQRSRAAVEQQQRAGVVEYRAVRAFEEWGLADRLVGDAVSDGVMEFRVDGETRLLGQGGGDDSLRMSLCPQHVFVRRSIAALLDAGGDVRFDASDVAVHGIEQDRPTVTYRDPSGAAHEIECAFVAGCDGARGVCRPSLPDGVLREYAFDTGISWLTVIADAPPPRHPLMAVSAYGFAGHFLRGPGSSRFYIQCGRTDRVADWPDDRVWDELRRRLGRDDLPTGPITSRETIALRSAVYEPMSHGRLFLLGDAAHVVVPTGGKGMNLALHDAEVFVHAVRAAVRDGDHGPLGSYSADCLRRVWNYQEFCHWLTETLHDAGGSLPAGQFRRRLARARLDRLSTSPTAARAFAEFMAGLA